MWCRPLMYFRRVGADTRLWDITACRLVRSYRRFEEWYWFRLQGQAVQREF
jgi:hypothetical protein